MRKIFVIGAYFNTDSESTDVYPYIVNVLKSKFPDSEIIMPTDIEDYRERCIYENPQATLKEINKAMVDFDLDMVKSSDLLFADVSNKSTGLGIELGIAKEYSKKIVFVANEKCGVSNMVFGAFPEHEVKRYASLEDLKNIILNTDF